MGYHMEPSSGVLKETGDVPATVDDGITGALSTLFDEDLVHQRASLVFKSISGIPGSGVVEGSLNSFSFLGPSVRLRRVGGTAPTVYTSDEGIKGYSVILERFVAAQSYFPGAFVDFVNWPDGHPTGNVDRLVVVKLGPGGGDFGAATYYYFADLIEADQKVEICAVCSNPTVLFLLVDDVEVMRITDSGDTNETGEVLTPKGGRTRGVPGFFQPNPGPQQTFFYGAANHLYEPISTWDNWSASELIVAG